ncbi:hypothetical protein M441DRAFT_61583 [Trichoderma asperellum CBS 433.97]|uniref:Uncharacterized protein n=1 Tax=Trichoderma asperellum (strain ATCC 204424 / CBS 433.97 / NBRC 101777) TaxID=1042311 RepID=A0A2T3YWG1_TRIA4|nr:hypothetical protein M441DRAFT_61583 [Trichoderma asperellum CBS 433.97]PTB36864.1 hypothetical protein M441DRAFT_61583 [Trichoderma asperellum CBS 433.97]
MGSFVLSDLAGESRALVPFQPCIAGILNSSYGLACDELCACQLSIAHTRPLSVLGAALGAVPYAMALSVAVCVRS